MIAFVGLLSPACAAAIKSWNEASGDRELAKHYANTWDKLNALSSRRCEFNEAVVKGDRQTSEKFVDEIIAVLRADHEAFIELRRRSMDARKKLVMMRLRHARPAREDVNEKAHGGLETALFLAVTQRPDDENDATGSKAR